MKVRPCPAALHGPSSSTLPAGRLDPCGVNPELLPRHDEPNLWQFVLLVKCWRGWKASGRRGAYLTAFPADAFVPLGPFINSGSVSRWHWFRKSQTWFIQEAWALIITLPPFLGIIVSFSFFFCTYIEDFYWIQLIMFSERNISTKMNKTCRMK